MYAQFKKHCANFSVSKTTDCGQEMSHSQITDQPMSPWGRGIRTKPKTLNLLFTGNRLTDTLANSEDPDEMQHYAAFHQGLHCLLSSKTEIIIIFNILLCTLKLQNGQFAVFHRGLHCLLRLKQHSGTFRNFHLCTLKVQNGHYAAFDQGLHC